jgi:hypothetical protein
MGTYINNSSSSTSRASASGGIGFIGLLTIAFIVLKLCHIIEWSWAWVLSPLWITGGLVVLILIVLLIFFLKS